ncbi:hypothetical protein C8Q74DRAFT_1380692 [Fomes fomentarius]|nr:hypothetical protein C8Q74DRAFT_1380692 [Fomes fomentarius]
MHIDLLRWEEFRELEIQLQFDHLSETYFNNFEYDLGERELGYTQSLTMTWRCSPPPWVSSRRPLMPYSRTRTSVDVEVNLGSVDPEADFFEPSQKLLDQCRSAKVLSRKLMKPVEDLTQDSMTLKSHLLVNFGFSLAQLVMPHNSDVRAAKSAFELSTVLSLITEIAGSTVGKGRTDNLSPWESVSEFLNQVMQEAGRIVPLSLESENTLKILGTAPWVLRIDEIKAATAVNVKAERKVAKLNDEMQALTHSLRVKDQTIQETGVKIELMERRMEMVKKQADTITDLENELAKARKQERAYEEAMEQLQVDFDVLEQDNSKLKAIANNPERQPSTTQVVEPKTVPTESNLETLYLVMTPLATLHHVLHAECLPLQIEALRGTICFLRSENSFLKAY